MLNGSLSETDYGEFSPKRMLKIAASQLVSVALSKRLRRPWSEKSAMTMTFVFTRVCTSFAVDFTNSTTKGWLTKTMNITMGRNCTDGFL